MFLKTTRFRSLWRIAGIALLTALVPAVASAKYPSKAVTIVAPYGAGGASDLAARNLAAVAPKYLGERVQVINKTGASGIVGSNYVHNAAPNGYTLLLARVGSEGIAPAINTATPYKYDGFTYLGMLELNPVVLAVNKASPYKNFGDLVSALKAHKNITYSTSGPDTLLNMCVQDLLSVLKLPPNTATQVPYKGGGQAVTAVLGNHVDLVCVNLSAAISGIQAGKLRALAVTTPKRVKTIPNVPTAKEVGYPQLEAIVGWSALYGPPGLPKSVVHKWTQVLQHVSHDKAWLKSERKLGSVPYIKSPKKTAKFVTTQHKTYHDLGKKLDLIK